MSYITKPRALTHPASSLGFGKICSPLEFSLNLRLDYIALLNYFSDSVIKSKEDYVPLHIGGSMILGQEQDGKPGFDPKFDKKQGFSGQVTQVELWNTILSKSEINKLAHCKIHSLRSQNRVVTWESEGAWIARQANFMEVPIKKLCKQNLILNNLVWPKAIDFHTFNNYCSTLDGKLFT